LLKLPTKKDHPDASKLAGLPANRNHKRTTNKPQTNHKETTKRLKKDTYKNVKNVKKKDISSEHSADGHTGLSAY
jgi:hypothetical protein